MKGPPDRLRALSFDLDGTLVRVGWRWARLAPALAAHPRLLAAYPAAFRAARARRGDDLAATVAREVAARCGANPERTARWLRDLIEVRVPACHRGAPVPKSVAALIRASDEAGLPRAVVSDYPALAKLAAIGLGGWTAVVDCRRLGALKPWPDGLLAASAQLGVRPSELLHVGNRWDTDGIAAARAGCRFLHVDDLDPHDPWNPIQP